MPTVKNCSPTVPTLTQLSWTQAGAVQNQWYEAFNLKNVSFLLLGVGITVADETVEARVTIDGVVYTGIGAVNLLFGSNNVAEANRMASNITSRYLSLGSPSTTVYSTAYVANCIQGKAVKFEVRKTTNAGASALKVFGLYHQY